MYISRFQSIRDPRDPLMKSLVRSSRAPIRGTVRIARPAARALVVEGTKVPQAWACMRCGYTYSLQSYSGTKEARNAYARSQAEKCCDNRCTSCQTPVKRHYSHCDACNNKRRMRDRRAWAKRATPCRLKDTDWIFADGYGYRDGYFMEFAELEEWCLDEGIDLPSYVYPCTEVTVEIDAAELYERLDEESGLEDSWSEHARGTDELEAAIEAFNKANSGPAAWQADFTRVIIIDAERFNAEFGTDNNGTPITSWRDQPPTVDPMTLAKYRAALAKSKTSEAAA